VAAGLYSAPLPIQDADPCSEWLLLGVHGAQQVLLPGSPGILGSEEGLHGPCGVKAALSVMCEMVLVKGCLAAPGSSPHAWNYLRLFYEWPLGSHPPTECAQSRHVLAHEQWAELSPSQASAMELWRPFWPLCIKQPGKITQGERPTSSPGADKLPFQMNLKASPLKPDPICLWSWKPLEVPASLPGQGWQAGRKRLTSRALKPEPS
jgi:hypothetical protein